MNLILEEYYSLIIIIITTTRRTRTTLIINRKCIFHLSNKKSSNNVQTIYFLFLCRFPYIDWIPFYSEEHESYFQENRVTLSLRICNASFPSFNDGSVINKERNEKEYIANYSGRTTQVLLPIIHFSFLSTIRQEKKKILKQ